MAFKDVKQNYSVYILNKQDITITDGKVISVGFPHLDLNTKPTMGQSQMVVDVTIEANSKTATYSIPENLSVTMQEMQYCLQISRVLWLKQSR